MSGADASALTRYAARVLAGTGIGVADVPDVVAGQDCGVVAAALRDGWRCASGRDVSGGVG